MSADNWRECPQCRDLAEQAKITARQTAEKSYGKVPAEKYLEMLKALDEVVELEETFREDWEIGVSDDYHFFVKYSGACSHCGLRFEYRKEIDIRTNKEIK